MARTYHIEYFGFSGKWNKVTRTRVRPGKVTDSVVWKSKSRDRALEKLKATALQLPHLSVRLASNFGPELAQFTR